jgi:hypothetical protein
MEEKLTTYECGVRLQLDEGTMVPIDIKAATPEKAAEKFAHYAHTRMGAWEWGYYWDGDQAIAVRPKGRQDYRYYNVERRVVPEFTATAA